MSRNTKIQTAIRLPRTRNGVRIQHPLFELLKTSSPEQIGVALSIDRSTVYHHLKKARDNRDGLVQAELVLALSKLSGIEPHYFRPDIYPKEGIPAIK